jgi:hypothetical protein
MSPRLFCNIVYTFLVRNADEKERARIDEALYAPVEGGNDLNSFLVNLMNEDEADDGS